MIFVNCYNQLDIRWQPCRISVNLDNGQHSSEAEGLEQEPTRTGPTRRFGNGSKRGSSLIHLLAWKYISSGSRIPNGSIKYELDTNTGV